MGHIGRALVAIALSASVSMAGGGGSVPNPDAGVDRQDGILAVMPLHLPSRGQACLGSDIPMTFAVKNVAPGVEVPMPVVGATVTVRDDRGKVRALETNGAGIARFTWPADTEGQISFTVDAAKQFYKPAGTFSFRVQVAACQWALAVDFHEEYAIVSQVSLVVGADVRWRGMLTSTPGQGEDAVSDITLAGGTGTYQFYASDKIGAPFHFTLDPAISGPWDLHGKGQSDGRTVSLDLQTVAETYPEIVTLKVTDSSNRDIQVNFKPPVPLSGGNGLFIELNRLSQLTFPASGGVVSISSGMSCYFYTPNRTAYSLTIRLYPVKQQSGGLGRGTLAEVLP